MNPRFKKALVIVAPFDYNIWVDLWEKQCKKLFIVDNNKKVQINILHKPKGKIKLDRISVVKKTKDKDKYFKNNIYALIVTKGQDEFVLIKEKSYYKDEIINCLKGSYKIFRDRLGASKVFAAGHNGKIVRSEPSKNFYSIGFSHAEKNKFYKKLKGFIESLEKNIWVDSKFKSLHEYIYSKALIQILIEIKYITYYLFLPLYIDFKGLKKIKNLEKENEYKKYLIKIFKVRSNINTIYPSYLYLLMGKDWMIKNDIIVSNVVQDVSDWMDRGNFPLKRLIPSKYKKQLDNIFCISGINKKYNIDKRNPFYKFSQDLAQIEDKRTPWINEILFNNKYDKNMGVEFLNDWLKKNISKMDIIINIIKKIVK